MDTPDVETQQEQTFRQRILKTYFVRFHMGLILTSVVTSGVLGSKLLLYVGIHSMALRYSIAVLLSYAVFLLMIRIWIWWVSSAKLALDLSLNNGWGSGGSSGSSSGNGGRVSFGGGSSGGGGATNSWTEGEARGLVSQGRASGSSTARGGNSGGWFSGLGDIDGDDWWILLLLALLVLSILCAGGYLIYAAPQFLPEAAWQAALAGGLRRMTTRKPDWMLAVMRSSAIPFAVVLIFAVVLGWQAQKYCPGASRLVDVFSCPAELTAR